jgi:hypothetical protein
MRKIREILRLKWVAERSDRETARSLGVSPGAVASAVSRARARGLTWEAVDALSDDALERTLYGSTPAEIDGARPEPDLTWIHQELRRPDRGQSHPVAGGIGTSSARRSPCLARIAGSSCPHDVVQTS